MIAIQDEKNLFKPQAEIMLPDNTLLSAIFSNNDVSNEFMDKLSLAKGRITAVTSSEIHFHPIVSQVTYVLSGRLTIIMKGKNDEFPYKVALQSGESVVTHPYTFFQMVNESNVDCEVLYIVNPAFLFELNDAMDDVIYNDAFVLEESWGDLERKNWIIPALQRDPCEFEELRRLAKLRLMEKKEKVLTP